MGGRRILPRLTLNQAPWCAVNSSEPQGCGGGGEASNPFDARRSKPQETPSSTSPSKLDRTSPLPHLKRYPIRALLHVGWWSMRFYSPGPIPHRGTRCKTDRKWSWGKPGVFFFPKQGKHKNFTFSQSLRIGNKSSCLQTGILQAQWLEDPRSLNILSWSPGIRQAKLFHPQPVQRPASLSLKEWIY